MKKPTSEGIENSTDDFAVKENEENEKVSRFTMIYPQITCNLEILVFQSVDNFATISLCIPMDFPIMIRETD